MSHSVALISLGCAKNLADSEDLVTALRELDFALCGELAEADLVLINTCGFVTEAKQESIDHILTAIEGRRSDAKLFVAGCLTQRYRAELAADMPEVDAWLGFADYPRLPAIIASHFPEPARHQLRHDQRSQLTPPHYAYLKIAEGCDNSCTFCAIPLIRGRHVSRPFEEVVEQARLYHQRGVREIALISQHLDYYGQDRYHRRRLPELVRAVAAAAPESWIRLHYLTPHDCDDALIAAIAETPQVVHYLDMPIQHASDRCLKRMGRRDTRARIEERLTAIRSALPEVVLRSAFIVGFPGESEEDFQILLDFIQEQAFDQVGCFAYSREEGTAAARLDGIVAEDCIHERHDRFMRLQQAVHQQRLQRWLGRRLEVLVDEQLDFGRYAARHYGQAAEVDNRTLVDAERLDIGARCTVVIDGLEGYDLHAVPV